MYVLHAWYMRYDDILHSMLATISKLFSHVYHSIINFFAHHKTYTAFLFLMVTAIVFYALFSTPKISNETMKVALGPIKQYVKVSGQVASSRDANLSFQTVGSVAFVGIKIGDAVRQGQVLATLSAGDAQVSLLQAKANLANAQAVLSQLEQGPRVEETAIKEQLVNNAKGSLDQVYASLPDTIQNVDAVTADIVKNKFSPLFSYGNGRYQITFSSCDQRLQGEVESKRTALEDTLAAFQKRSSVITSISSIENIDATFELAYRSALATNELVNAVSGLLLAPCSSNNPTLEGYRVTLSAVKTAMTALFSDITLKRSSLITAKNSFSQSSRDLQLLQAGTDPYKIKAQAAVVAQAEAQVAQAESGLGKTMITAPFSGVVSNVDLSIGETVSLGKTVISMLATEGYEVEAKVPEIDIVKVKSGASVDVTLDAYGKDIIFPATITRINPAATIEGTVPVYKVIVTFTGKDPRIKQGMTANVQIVTETKSKVVAVPARFVKILTSEKGTVTLLVDGKESVRDVVLGIRGDGGLIEVIQGLVGGETLVSPITTDRQAQKQTTN